MIDLKGLKRPSKGATAYIGARINPDLKARLERVCNAEGISVSSVIAELIRAFLTTKGETDGQA